MGSSWAMGYLCLRPRVYFLNPRWDGFGFGANNRLRLTSSKPSYSLAAYSRNFFMDGAIVAILSVFLCPNHWFWRGFELCVGAELAGLSVSEQTSFSKKIISKKVVPLLTMIFTCSLSINILVFLCHAMRECKVWYTGIKFFTRRGRETNMKRIWGLVMISHRCIMLRILEVSFNLYSAKSFLTMGFTFVILSIMIILVGVKKTFAVCNTIKKIPTFPIWNYFHLLFRIIFCSFFFLYHNFTVPHPLLFNS